MRTDFFARQFSSEANKCQLDDSGDTYSVFNLCRCLNASLSMRDSGLDLRFNEIKLGKSRATEFVGVDDGPIDSIRLLAKFLHSGSRLDRCGSKMKIRV